MTLPIHSIPPAAKVTAASSIGHVLLDMGKITPENAEAVLRLQKEKGVRFGEAAVQLGFITEEDIQKVLARQFDYPYLHSADKRFSSKLVAAYEPFSPQVEALRSVRSQLMLRWFAQARKSLTVLSLEPGDDGANLASNLAVVFSQLGERTLLVDANMRNPRQQNILSLAQRNGLSDVLAGRAELDVIVPVDAFVSLSLLPAGTVPPNPQELLGRDAFHRNREALERMFDVVLYDAPPLAESTDGLTLAARTGGVLLVLRRNTTRYEDVALVADRIGQMGAALVGTVMVDN
ncbi:chain length determinant protein tyrosine kinase EpsG [Massilia sp. METH4]|uniref:chain length determinant protein tyrosine kinase EpsG n=1 Tax=Massilia sp. METH4 TaxID=3123041 RepID=UPI0030D40AAA